MYACIPYIEGGFFQGVRTSSTTTVHLRDHPLTHRELTLAMPVAARVNEANVSLACSRFGTFTVDPRTPHRRHLHRDNSEPVHPPPTPLSRSVCWQSSAAESPHRPLFASHACLWALRKRS
jgi:hypothetical protein